MITTASKPPDRGICAGDKISIEVNNLRTAPLKINSFN